MKWFLFFVCLFFAAHTYGDDTDPGLDTASQSALKSTDEMLKDRNAREKAAQENVRSKQAYDYAKKVGGSEENVDEMFGISSELMTYLTEKYHGDTTAIQKVLVEASTNPEAFFNSLPDNIKGKVRGLASKLPQPTKPKD